MRLTKNSGSSGNPSIGVGGSQSFVIWQDLTPGNNEICLMHKKLAGADDTISVISPMASTVRVKGETEKIEWRITEGAVGQVQTGPAGQNSTASSFLTFSEMLRHGQEAGSASLTDLLAIEKVNIDLYDGP